MAANSIVFIQNRVHKAGAQTCLARLLAHERMKTVHPLVIVSTEGWFTEKCRQSGVRCIPVKFPKSRSLAGRLFANALFVRQVKKELTAAGIRPVLVQANDHQEGLLGLGLARAFRVPAGMFLRSAWMSERDFFKYRCNEFDLLSAVGPGLRERANAWHRRGEVLLIPDGVDAGECESPKEKPACFPERILVIGSPHRMKGWRDVVDALDGLDKEMHLPVRQVDFTGERPDPGTNDLQLGKSGRISFRFLGRVEAFSELVRDYDMVLNPSRGESFGMGALEVWMAGVPLLSSRTGIIEDVVDREYLLFEPDDSADLAKALKNLILNWNELEFDVSGIQRSILQKYDIGRSVEKLLCAYGTMGVNP